MASSPRPYKKTDPPSIPGSDKLYLDGELGRIAAQSKTVVAELASLWAAIPVLANPTGLIGMAAVNGALTTVPRSDSRHAIDPAIAPDWTGRHRWLTTTGSLPFVTIDPSGSTVYAVNIQPKFNQKGLHVAQTLSSPSDPWNGALFEVNDGSGVQSFGQLTVNSFLTAGWGGQKSAMNVGMYIDGDGDGGSGIHDVIARGVSLVARHAQTTAFPNIGLFGDNIYMDVTAAATGVEASVGAEIDMAVSTSAPIQARVGWNIVSAPSSDGTGSQGTIRDAAYHIGCVAVGSCAWKTGLSASGYNGIFPFDSNSTFIEAEAGTIGWGINFSAATFTNFAIKTPGFSVDPSGNIAIGASSTIDWNATGNTSATAVAGAATLPANPVGFLRIKIGGTTYKLPYYAN